MDVSETYRKLVRQNLINANEFPTIPEGWGVERLRFLFRESKERNGSSPVGQMLSVSEYRGVVPREYDTEEQKRTDDELQTYRVVRPGQLAVNSMWLNHLGLGVSDHEGHVSPAYEVYDISDRLDRRFVHHLMRSEYYLKIYMRYLYGIRPNSFQIKADDWKSIPIIVPDLPTQRQIADFLDRETARIDLLIEKKQRLVALLGEKWEAKIQSEVSGEKSSEKDPSENPFVAAVPKGWRLQSLKGVFHLVSGFAFKSEFFRQGETDLPILVTPGSFNPNGGLYTTRGIDVGYCGDFESRFLLEKGSMVVAMTDLSYRKLILGRCEFVDRDGMLLNQRIAKIVNIHSDVRPDFLRYAMNARSSREQVSLSATGATVFHSSSDKIRSIYILVPPLEVQDRIVSKLDMQDILNRNLVKDINTSITRLREYRSALITAAVTGQLDVTAHTSAGATDRQLDRLEETCA